MLFRDQIFVFHWLTLRAELNFTFSNLQIQKCSWCEIFGVWTCLLNILHAKCPLVLKKLLIYVHWYICRIYLLHFGSKKSSTVIYCPSRKVYLKWWSPVFAKETELLNTGKEIKYGNAVHFLLPYFAIRVLEYFVIFLL